MQVHESAIRGLGVLVRPLIFHKVLHPALLAIALPLAVIGFGATPTADVAMAIYLVATMVALAGLWSMLRAKCPQAVRRASPSIEARQWLNASFAMMFLMSFGPILNQITVIVLGALDGNAAAGQYGAAVRISYIVQPLIMAQITAIAPMTADLYARGDHAELQRIIRLGVRIVSLSALAVAIAVVVLGEWILGLLGEEFVAAYPIVVVLIAGHLLFAAAGPAAILLNMTGFHVASARILAVSAVVSLAASLILIPIFGALGAALAAVLTIICSSGLMAYAAYRRLGIVSVITFPLGRKRFDTGPAITDS
jgi:O-antigen/teichoic acid export membrane protein